MQDFHIHTTFSDGSDTPEAMIRAAVAANITTLGICDHVNASTDWVPEYVETIHRLRADSPIEVTCGAEATMLDTHGNLDLPENLFGIEYVAIADHRMPTPYGPAQPEQIRRRLDAGALDEIDVFEMIIKATAEAASSSPAQPIVAHLFSILPKVGIREDDIPLRLVDVLVRRLRRAHAWVEINEKWRSPGRDIADRLARGGVRLVAGSDSHTAAEVGWWAYVASTGDDLITPRVAA